MKTTLLPCLFALAALHAGGTFAAPAAVPGAGIRLLATAASGEVYGIVGRRSGDWMPPTDPTRAKWMPLRAQIQVYQGTTAVAATCSDAQGHFRLALPPGRYLVTAEGFSRIARIEIEEGQSVQVDFVDNSDVTF